MRKTKRKGSSKGFHTCKKLIPVMFAKHFLTMDALFPYLRQVSPSLQNKPPPVDGPDTARQAQPVLCKILK